MMTDIPRKEFPDPQFRRERWETLNGEWEFEQDPTVIGVENGYFAKDHFSKTILVPFCPESRLSGIGDRNFQTCVWYRRDFVPSAAPGERTVLHFGAVDYEAAVWVNSRKIMTHKGGYASFSCDITDALTEGKNSICVRALDEDLDPLVGHGKQSRKPESWRCFYTRVTGIWQSVWVEYVPAAHLRSFRFAPDPETGSLTVHFDAAGDAVFSAFCSFEGREVGSVRAEGKNGANTVTFPLTETHLWEVGKGGLYDITLRYGEDEVFSYFGIRSIELRDHRFFLNGRSVFQRLVLDQGYYPDGIYTAPDAQSLEKDILLSMRLGFNGARLHQKVFEPLYLYYCDLHGYLAWGEYGDWGCDTSNPAILPAFLSEWEEILRRDVNHPAIVGWCPFNETKDTEGRKRSAEVLTRAYRATKALDPTRPCIDTSGYYHADETDIYDTHDYTQDPAVFALMYAKTSAKEILENYCQHHVETAKYGLECPEELPFFVSEYGGIKWNAKEGNEQAWGYGNAPRTKEEFLSRYAALTDILLDNPRIMGFCYTQLYDVEQETNGIYTYGREPKFDDLSFFFRVNSRRAAWEL